MIIYIYKMNFTEAIVEKFTEPENCRVLYVRIQSYFRDDERVVKYLKSYFNTNVETFVRKIRNEMLMTDQLPGMTVARKVKCLNTEFVGECTKFIKDMLFKKYTPRFYLTDGKPTARFSTVLNPNGSVKDCKELLSDWRVNVGTGIQFRDDYGECKTYESHGVMSGIDVCDQSKVGMNYCLNQFYTPMIRQLNAMGYAYENTPIGVPTAAANARLLERRIFNKNSSGVADGIPDCQQRLWNRYMDRNTSEDMPYFSLDNVAYKNDRTSLFARQRDANIVKWELTPSVPRFVY